jgi:hypothetical protein
MSTGNNIEEEANALRASYLHSASVELFLRSVNDNAGEGEENGHAEVYLSQELAMAALEAGGPSWRQVDQVQMKIGNNSKEQPSLSIVDEAFVCRGCGAYLVPGMHGATVRARSTRRGKTRRRRALRQQYKHHMKAKLAVRSDPRRRLPVEDLETLEKKEQEQQNNLRRVRDGSCANAVIYTCGKCFTKASFRGISVYAKQRHTAAVREERQKKKVADQKQHQRSTSTLKNSKQNSVSSSSSFLSKRLQSSASPAAVKLQQQNRSRSPIPGTGSNAIQSSKVHSFSKRSAMATHTFASPPTTNSRPPVNKSMLAAPKDAHTLVPDTRLPLSLGSRKKKKKNSQPGNKSGLLDFLSSLND